MFRYNALQQGENNAMPIARFVHWTPFLTTLLLCTVALRADADTGRDQAFGEFVLDVIEVADTGGAIADKIRARSIEFRGESVTAEERHWYEHRHKDKSTAKPGGGPPPWAPAHGYRRKFGQQETQDLGLFTHRRVQEGLSGNELVIAIRGAIERVVRDEPVEVDDRTSEHQRRDEDVDDHRNVENEESRKSHGQQRSKGKRDGKGRK
jgi:hypothetical protein